MKKIIIAGVVFLLLLGLSAPAFAVIRFDGRGNMIEDAAGNMYTYDNGNRMLSMTDTTGRTMCWVYNSAGVLIRTIDFNGN